MKRKKFSGFTLIEMIIVVATFAIIMICVLSFMDPVKKVYKNTYNEADSQAIGENMRRYIGDQIQYADRMVLYTNMFMDDTTIQDQVNDFRNFFYFEPSTGTPPGETAAVEKKRIYPYPAFEGNDEIFVLHITNPDPSVDLTSDATVLPVTTEYGTISLSRYIGGVKQPDVRIWSENTDYYTTYAFDISVQTAIKDSSDNYKFVDIDETADPGTTEIKPNNLAMGIKMYRKNRIKGNFSNVTFEDTHTNRTITFKLKNLVSSANTLTDEVIEFQNNKFSVDPRRRFRWFDNTKVNVDGTVPSASASKDIYFIYTKVPYIEDVV